MKLKFKNQAYQTRAVESVVDCFRGQPNMSGVSYRIDPGMSDNSFEKAPRMTGADSWFEESGFKNGDIILTEQQVLENLHS